MKIKKAYVILPTKIYTIDNSYENTYSSKFKKIREICDILKESPDINIPKYYKRKQREIINHLKMIMKMK